MAISSRRSFLKQAGASSFAAAGLAASAAHPRPTKRLSLA